MTPTDAELVNAVQAGNRAAFAELVARYERAVWARAWRVLGDYHAAQDATQNAFVEAFRQIGQLRRAASFGLWLMRIAERESVRVSRRENRLKTIDLSLIETEAAAVEIADGDATLLSSVGALPDHDYLWWLAVRRREFTVENGVRVPFTYRSPSLEAESGVLELELTANYRGANAARLPPRAAVSVHLPSEPAARTLIELAGRVRRDIREIGNVGGGIAGFVGAVKNGTVGHLDSDTATDQQIADAITNQIAWLRGHDQVGSAVQVPAPAADGPAGAPGGN